MKRKKSFPTNNNAHFFDKQYQFHNTEKWHLPQSVFTECHWQVPSLQAKKDQLNATKEKLNNYDLATWSLHTKKRDPSTLIIKTIRKHYNPELLTQAWCKFYECLSRFNLIRPELLERGSLNSLHLCEAPGGFISALNHYLHTKYINLKLNWHANTLNPSYEGNPTNRMIPDDRLITFTKESWLFGADNTGDVMKSYNYKDITDKILKKYPEKVDLITADGSIDCMSDPGNQERHVEHLHYCEVITALTLLETGGNFVLKIFTTFEDSTISLLYLLNCAFTTVSIIKPITSKSGNSETYVINQGFRGHQLLTPIWPQLLNYYENPSKKSKAMFAFSDIPDDFVSQIEECADYFMHLQINTIHENINRFGQESKQYNYHLFKHQTEIVNKFLTLYPIQALTVDCHIVPEHELKLSMLRSGCMKKSGLYKLYKHSIDIKINCSIVYGKRVEKVLYSKFAQVDELHEKVNINIFNNKSLFNLTKNDLSKTCEIIDCNDLPKMQYLLHHEFLQRILLLFNSNHKNKNVLIINLSLISNFTVGLIFILSQEFKIYFFKHGLIYLQPITNNKGGYKNIKDCLTTINNAITTITKREEFDNDVIELVDYAGYDNIFFNCVYFYNSHLC